MTPDFRSRWSLSGCTSPQPPGSVPMRRLVKPALIAVLILAAGIFVKGSITQPSIGGWLSAGSMTEARSSAASALLQDGRILITGGDNGSGPTASAEFFDTT